VSRAATLEAAPGPLTDRQRAIYDAIVEYCRFLHTSECPASYIAERFGLNHETVRRDYFGALAKKGWIQHHRTPARPFLDRR